jgi:hypothetical protein
VCEHGRVTATVTIPARYCGPPQSANGGYTCGLLAARLPDGGRSRGPAEVTLRKPPPLERLLRVEDRGDATVLLDGDTVVAEAVPARVDVDPPAPLGAPAARAAERMSPVVVHPGWHPFPSCFVCGPERWPGDGLRLFPGRVDGTDLFAVAWTPGAEVDDGDGNVRDEFVWAALDCPTSFVMYLAEGRPEEVRVLGRLAARIDAPPRAGEEHVVVAWPLAREGRKLTAAGALYDGTGRVLAVSRAVWISIA